MNIYQTPKLPSRNNGSIVYFSILFDGKVNLVDALGEGGQNSIFPLVFKSAEKNKKKLRKTSHFYAKSIFEKIDFGFWCNTKYMKISLVVYISILYT